MTVKYKKNLEKKDIANNIKFYNWPFFKKYSKNCDDIIDETIKVLIQNKKIKYQKFWIFLYYF